MQDFLTAMKKRPLHLFFWDMNYYVCSPERYCSSYCGDLNWNTLFFSCPFVNSIFNEICAVHVSEHIKCKNIYSIEKKNVAGLGVYVAHWKTLLPLPFSPAVKGR